MLTEVEREHLFLLGLGRPPEVRYRAAEAVPPRLQRVLDALELSPACVRTSTWDIVAWNRAAGAVLFDYGSVPPEQRNVLRQIFCNPRVRAVQSDSEHVARFVVAAFRADVARAGVTANVKALVDELCRLSPTSKRSGMKMTCEPATARRQRLCAIRLPEESTWSTRHSRSMDRQISAGDLRRGNTGRRRQDPPACHAAHQPAKQ